MVLAPVWFAPSCEMLTFMSAPLRAESGFSVILIYLTLRFFFVLKLTCLRLLSL